MRALWFVAFISCATAGFATEDAPGEYTFKSPSGRFTIVERWIRPEYIAENRDCTPGECGWKAVVQFADKSKHEVILADEPEWYAWPADYRISSDEKWIIRDQKTGSGENSFFLYRVAPEGDIWRRVESVDDAVFAALFMPLHRTRRDYYHLAITLVSWDLAAGRLHLKASATPNDRKDEIISGRAVTYDLNKHVATPE
jgi:hypothetical protein